MRATLVQRAAHARQPMIKFLGKRQTPQHVDHTPQPHPAAPSHSLPDSFASYRSRAQQHGPMGGPSSSSTSAAVAAAPVYGQIGGTPGSRLGSVTPKQGEFFDRSELPKRFARLQWTEQEMEAVSSGGASLW